MRNKILKIFILLLAFSFIIACGDKEEKTPTPDVPTVDEPTPEEPTPDVPQIESIKIEGTDTVKVGETVSFNAVVTPANAIGVIKWSVSSDELANISEEGVLTAKKEGSLLVIAEAGSVKCEYSVSILPKDKLEASIKAPSTITEGDSVTIEVECNYGEEFEFVFSIDNEDIAMIDENGEFTAFEVGEVNIIVKPKDELYSEYEFTHKIVIEKAYDKPYDIKVDGASSCKKGDSIEFNVLVYPNTAKQEYYFEVENKEIGYMEDNKFFAVKEGTTDITVYHIDNEISTKFTVTVFNYNINNEVKLYDGVERYMTASEYWIGLQDDADKVLLTYDQIADFNKKAYVTNNTKLVDLSSVGETINGSKVKSMIESYSISSSVKINGVSMSSTYRTNLLNNTNKNNLASTITVKYGLVNEFSSLRTFPTMDLATTTNSFDRFQETGLEVGTGCLIYHESLDGKWYFVQTFNYYGWVLKEMVTEVSKDEMFNYLEPENFVIVIAKDMKVGNLDVRMSTKFPVLNKTDKEYTLITVGKKGLEITKAPVCDDLHYGYLDYTKANILTQVFKLLNEYYRWGDGEFDGHDCSSTMNAVYHCFGFRMSRNTSNQECLPYTKYNVSGKSDADKKAILDNLQVGSLVFVSGHVMMYLGKVNNDYYIIHNFNSYGGCNITTSRLLRSGSTTYLTAYTVFLEFK